MSIIKTLEKPYFHIPVTILLFITMYFAFICAIMPDLSPEYTYKKLKLSRSKTLYLKTKAWGMGSTHYEAKISSNPSKKYGESNEFDDLIFIDPSNFYYSIVNEKLQIYTTAHTSFNKKSKNLDYVEFLKLSGPYKKSLNVIRETMISLDSHSR